MTEPAARPASPSESADLLSVGGWTVYVSRRRLEGPAGEVVQLEPKVLAVLLELAARPAQVVTRRELLDAVWEGGEVTDSVLSRAISTLRKAFGEGPGPASYLETIPKTGYRLVAPVVRGRAAALAREGGSIEAAGQARRGQQRIPWRRIVWVVLPVAVLIVLWPRARRVPAPVRPQPLTAFRGSELDPVLSPDGSRLAFAWNGEGGADFDIYLRPIEGGPSLRLTDHPGEEKNPAWSPEGDRIAFVRDAAGEPGIFVVPAARGESRRLADTGTGDIPDLVWSRDGRYLFFPDRVGPGHPTAISRLDLSTGERRWVTRPPPTVLGDRDLAVSPDGGRVAFARAITPGVEDLWVARVPGGEETRLTRDGVPITGIEWLPESDELLFASERDGLSRFWRVPAAGGAPRVDAGLGEHGFDPSFAPAAARLVYERKVYDVNIWRAELDTPAEPRLWIESTRIDTLPSISPDGSRVAFLSDRGGPTEVWLLELDGGEPEQLSRLAPGVPGPPAWTPDGAELVLAVRNGPETDLVRLAVSDGGAVRLTSTPWQEAHPNVSRDGRQVYFGSDREGSWQIWRMPLDGGDAERVTEGGGYRAAEGPDGDVYYSFLDRPGLWRRTAAGVEESVLDAVAFAAGLEWTLGPGGIYVRALTPDPVAALPVLRLDPGTGALREVVPPIGRIGLYGLGLAVAPDGSYLLLGRTDRSDGDVMRVDGYR